MERKSRCYRRRLTQKNIMQRSFINSNEAMSGKFKCTGTTRIGKNVFLLQIIVNAEGTDDGTQTLVSQEHTEEKKTGANTGSKYMEIAGVESLGSGKRMAYWSPFCMSETGHWSEVRCVCLYSPCADEEHVCVISVQEMLCVTRN